MMQVLLLTAGNLLAKVNSAAASNGPPYMITLSIAHPLIYCVWSVVLLITGKLSGERK
jgi:hypothetical protein